MWFNKPTKQAFIFPTKTGSVTARNFLKNIGWRNISDQMTPPSVLIDKYPNLASYSIYGFVRDPLARFESAILFLKQIETHMDNFNKAIEESGINVSKNEISYDQVVDIFPVLREFSVSNAVFTPQHLWFDAPNVTVLDYENLEPDLRRITNNYDTPMDSYNVSTDVGRSVITQKVKDFVREYYAADYALIKDRLGKEY